MEFLTHIARKVGNTQKQSEFCQGNKSSVKSHSLNFTSRFAGKHEYNIRRHPEKRPVFNGYARDVKVYGI